MFRGKFNTQTLLLVALLSSMALFFYLLSTGGIYDYGADFNLHIGMHLDAILDKDESRESQKQTTQRLRLADTYSVLNRSMYRYPVPRDYSCYFRDKLHSPGMPDVHSAFTDPIAGRVVFVGLKLLKQKWHRENFACEFPDETVTTNDAIADDARSFGFMPQYVVVITCPVPERYRWRAYFNLTLRRLATPNASYANITVCTCGASPERQYRLAICTMVKSSDSFIPEWLDFHRYVGVEHVFIYDNEEEEKTILPETVDEYVKQGFVTVIPWSHSISQYKTYLEVQIAHENDCIWRHKYDTRWMIKIDVDEYIQPMDPRRPRVTDYLHGASLESVAALRVQNWFFGHPQHIAPTEDSVIARNLWRSKEPTLQNTGHDKNILQPINVHYFKIHNVKLGGDEVSADPHNELRMVHYRVDNPRALRFELPDFTVKDKSMLTLRDIVKKSKNKIRNDSRH